MSTETGSDKSSKQAGERIAPWVELRSVAYKTFIFKKMVGATSPDAGQGDVVNVYDRRGNLFGNALFNPRSVLALRMLSFDRSPWSEPRWAHAVEKACRLRIERLNLKAQTDTFRLVHAEGDELSGLTVDLYDDVLSIVVYSAGIWARKESWLPALLAASGARHFRMTFDAKAMALESINAEPESSDGIPSTITLQENGVRFAIDFDTGHKTGFFCDQRDNRMKLSHMTSGADVLDLCCFSGGFGIYAKTLGNANEVRCIDLDENAIKLAKRNANLNQARIDTVHADAFTYMRQMSTNGRTFGVVVLDPPKLIAGRKEFEAGLHKYRDMNRLAAGLVAPEGIMVTCSCSGAFGREDFQEMALAAARHAGRTCQLLDMTGPGMDHPVHPLCPESAYLKVAWLRMLD